MQRTLLALALAAILVIAAASDDDSSSSSTDAPAVVESPRTPPVSDPYTFDSPVVDMKWV